MLRRSSVVAVATGSPPDMTTVCPIDPRRGEGIGPGAAGANRSGSEGAAPGIVSGPGADLDVDAVVAVQSAEAGERAGLRQPPIDLLARRHGERADLVGDPVVVDDHESVAQR